MAARPLVRTTSFARDSSDGPVFTTTQYPMAARDFATSPKRSAGHCFAPHPAPGFSVFVAGQVGLRVYKFFAGGGPCQLQRLVNDVLTVCWNPLFIEKSCC